MNKKLLFPLGQVVATPGALALLEELQEQPHTYLMKHVSGDWAEMSEEDQQENRLSVEKGYRVFSSYTLRGGNRIWIITEADRSATTILLPSEY